MGSYSQQLPVRRRAQILDIFALGMHLVNRELKQFERILAQVHGHGEVRKQDPQRHSPPQEKGIFQVGGFFVPIVRFLLQFSQSADFDGHFVDHIKADCAQNDDGKDHDPERGEYVAQVGYEAQNVLPSFKQEVKKYDVPGTAGKTGINPHRQRQDAIKGFSDSKSPDVLERSLERRQKSNPRRKIKDQGNDEVAEQER